MSVTYSSPRKRFHRTEDSDEIISTESLTEPTEEGLPIDVTGLIDIDIEPPRDARKSEKKGRKEQKKEKVDKKPITIDDNTDDDSDDVSEMEAALRMGPEDPANTVDLTYDLEGEELRYGIK